MINDVCNSGFVSLEKIQVINVLQSSFVGECVYSFMGYVV